MELYRAHVLVCGGTGCTSSGSQQLMERFVRGEESRSTEGSGLGLSIARSLAELQGGTFRLDVDGDLFKATIIFPEAEEKTNRDKSERLV